MVGPFEVHQGGMDSSNGGPPRLGMCLCGGGLTGAFYEIGVLRAIDEYLGPGSVRGLFDVWVGVSAGSSVAGYLSQGVSPMRLYQAAWDLNDPFFPFNRHDLVRFESRRWLEAAGRGAWEVVKGFAMNLLRMPGVPEVDLESELEKALPGGIFSILNFAKIYGDSLKRNGLAMSFTELHRELVIPAVNLDTGEREVFAKGTRHETTPIAMAMAASSAIAGFYEPVRIGSCSYIDGGTGRAAHIDLAYQRGARSIIVINPLVPVRQLRPNQRLLGYGETIGDMATRGLFKVWGQAMRIGTNTRVKMGLRHFATEHPEVKIFLIEPPHDDATMFLVNPMNELSRHRILRHGYESTLWALRDRGEALRELTRPIRQRWKAPDVAPGAPHAAGEFHQLSGETSRDDEEAELAGSGW